MRPIVLMLLVTSLAIAQSRNEDSTKTYVAKEVVVTATRTTIPVSDSPSPVQIISRFDLESVNGQTVADALRNSYGIFLKDYGSSGALKTLSLRGTSSEQVLVLVNGVRYNSMQNGLVDLSLLPLQDIDRIEVVRGGSSAFYGADALGGVVNILTRQHESGLHARVEGSGGSFDYRRFFVQGEANLGPVGILAGFGREQGQDNFPFVVHSSEIEQTMERQNADFSKRQAFIHTNFLPSENMVANLSVQHVRSERGAPGPISFPSEQARQYDDGVNVLGSFKTFSDGGTMFSIASGFHYNYETYNDPNPGFPINSLYKNLFLNINPQYEMFLFPEYKIVLGGELGQGWLDGNDFDNRITRVQRSLYWSNQLTMDYAGNTFNRLSFYGTLRYDEISDVDKAFTPKVGINVRLLSEGEIHVRASYGGNFRAPTFNDMYYRGFSNPGLKPERSKSFDVGLTSAFLAGGEHSIELTYFNLNTENRILSDPVTYLPVNIGRAAAQGLEVRYVGTWLDNLLSVELNYAHTEAIKKNQDSPVDPTFEKQLVYIPQDVTNAVLSLHISQLTVNISDNLVGPRFTREDNSSRLPMYNLANFNAMIPFRWSGVLLQFKAEANNIFNRSYEVFQDYPMPMRNYRLSFSVFN